MDRKFKYTLIGMIIGAILGMKPILMLIFNACGYAEEGICIYFFLWPSVVIHKILFLTNTPTSDVLALFILIITPVVFALFGSIIGYLISRAFGIKRK